MVEQMDLFAASVSEEPKEERNEQKSELTPTHWDLYRLIYHNSLVEHRKTTQKEITEKIPFFEWDDDEKCHDHCVAVWRYIKDNNESLEHDKIIISKNFKYWVGSAKETKRFLRDLWKALSPRLKRYWKYVAKTKMDGLGKLFDKNGNPIDDNGKARAFHECFNAYDIELQQAIEQDIIADKESKKNGEERISENSDL